MKNKICTGIVTYNRLDLLKGAIESIKNQETPTDIVVINNGSTDGTAEYLNTVEGITVITQENVGGAGGFFTALKYITEKGYQFAWIMDDDIIARPDTLSNLYTAYEELSKKEKVGFLCSSVYSAEGETVNVPTVSTSHNSMDYPEWNKWLEKGYVKVDYATFVSVFLATDLIREVGLPYKEYFIWGDDTEYTKRISSKYPCYLVGTSKITHLRNGGFLHLKNIDDPNRIRMYQNFIRNNYNNLRLYSAKKDRILYILAFIRQSLYFAVHGKINKAQAILKGLQSAFWFKPEVIFPEGRVNVLKADY